ncbi:molecular chaperone [Paenalcaligenes sp. Me131]|uniref:fimbrial biogenesis chaperone n=1 Tax=Paenalcaligenes sp. Me131 TaxID=3392636 RepID=UPI003D26D2AC
MTKKKNILKIFALVASTLVYTQSFAAIQLNNTRVVIRESKNSGTVVAKNVSSDPFVVQSWIEGPSGEMETPLFVTPPLIRLEGKTDLALNIRKIDGSLPEDRESYFWLNVMEIPKESKDSENTLTLAVRTRIKIFYRPNGIGSPSDVDQALNWALIRNGNQCQVSFANTSPFNVNFSDISVGKVAVFGQGYVSPPFSEQVSDTIPCPTNTDLEAIIVNDYGAFVTLPKITIQ